jgi:hypothetical protein
MALTIHPHLALRLKKSKAIPLLPLWAFMAYSRVDFTFHLFKDKLDNVTRLPLPKRLAFFMVIWPSGCSQDYVPNVQPQSSREAGSVLLGSQPLRPAQQQAAK